MSKNTDYCAYDISDSGKQFKPYSMLAKMKIIHHQSDNSDILILF